MSQATACNNHNDFTFILVLTEGREGEVWELSNKMMPFLPPHKKSLSLSLYFLLYLLFCYIRYFSLSLSTSLQENVSSVRSVPRIYKEI
jgi:hypothetical protein